MTQISLIPITTENWNTAVKLQVAPDQKSFVAPNTISLLQAHYMPELAARPFGIYDGDEMVGFLMLVQGDFVPAGSIGVMRLMVAAEHQQKGYGRAALQQVISECQADAAINRVIISYELENTIAQKLYLDLGFVEQGIREDWDGEMEAWLELDKLRV